MQEQQQLRQFLKQNHPVTVLTGAGLSTASGIPDYRDSQGNWKISPPVQHRDFMQDEQLRKRYWARALHGWPVLYHAQPNKAHYALAQMQGAGEIGTIITQNVDGLHQKAGATDVINLHGYANEMICMSCGAKSPRLDMHERCLALNPQFADMAAAPLPDGDADIEADFDQFVIADCLNCGGILKPDVVYFGDTVPKTRVAEAKQALDSSSGLLVIGSSLMVFSGYRFARQAHAKGQPIALLTRGKTRADDLATIKLDVDISAVL
ncbi:NAD-dependent protein deacetylase [Idiomarina seosinensis]|uniref:NAD-dependent protein deacetylase n=1 Tax=Idiomarina seosinensis TaxID=281739 RepID=UPI00384BED0E